MSIKQKWIGTTCLLLPGWQHLLGSTKKSLKDIYQFEYYLHSINLNTSTVRFKISSLYVLIRRLFVMLHTFNMIIVNGNSHVYSSVRSKSESILSYFNECKFLLKEDDNIHLLNEKYDFIHEFIFIIKICHHSWKFYAFCLFTLKDLLMKDGWMDVGMNPIVRMWDLGL